jgi:regulator of cell morphogenesis and NO signaling
MHCGTIANPIRVMMMEHDDEVERHQRISLLTNNYSAPADASNDYKLLLRGLQDFAADLHEHVYIENEIIFPRCQSVEKRIVF